ncbi:enolase C-terminal domain-like protein [Streptomyces sp. NBC_00483]|uniref:enolase C-terminal domain-like protein n=1 Tax=Streptomyces sp. NBC_00483 TaxID=2975756 RepID=UPI002E17A349
MSLRSARRPSTSPRGESIYSYQQFTGFIAHDAVRVVQPDATRLGGVTEWRQVSTAVAARARRGWQLRGVGALRGA